MPSVVFSHGFGGNYQVGAQYAEALAAKGYVVYCFDFCGGSPESLSDGSTLEMSIFTEQADLEAVIAMIQNLDYVDSDNLFLMGTSQGGVVSAITAAEHQEEIRGAILLYPAFCLVDMTKERFDSAEEETTREYEIGDFGYWDDGPDLAIFYDDIYEQTVVPVIPLGKAESGAKMFADTSGTVTLELVEADAE